MKHIFIFALICFNFSLFAVRAWDEFRGEYDDGRIELKFECHANGPSGFWQDKEEAWNLHLAGWNGWDGKNWIRYYSKVFNNHSEALQGYRDALKRPLKHCTDKNPEYKAIIDAEKAKQARLDAEEARLARLEKAMGEMKRVTDEINEAYKKLVDLYTHPQATPNYKMLIDALTKRIQALEEYKKTLDV